MSIESPETVSAVNLLLYRAFAGETREPTAAELEDVLKSLETAGGMPVPEPDTHE